MARAVSLMNCDMGIAKSSFLFGTDAQGSGEGDFGGFGIIGRKINNTLFREIMKSGEAPGYTVKRLSDFNGASRPHDLQATIPTTLLPDSIFHDSEWHTISYGRWRFHDHITIGEARAVVRLLKRLAMFPHFSRSMIISLQDNLPTACAMSKGRSSSYPLLRIIRQKSATCLASGLRLFLPWVQSAKQPADNASRLQ